MTVYILFNHIRQGLFFEKKCWGWKRVWVKRGPQESKSGEQQVWSKESPSQIESGAKRDNKYWWIWMNLISHGISISHGPMWGACNCGACFLVHPSPSFNSWPLLAVCTLLLEIEIIKFKMRAINVHIQSDRFSPCGNKTDD